MQRTKIISKTTPFPASMNDTLTPVTIYLKLRESYPTAILLESSDYHHTKDSMSFLCFDSISDIEINRGSAEIKYANGDVEVSEINKAYPVELVMNQFLSSFEVEREGIDLPNNGLFGYTCYDAVKYFEDIEIATKGDDVYDIPEIKYCYYRYVISFNHFTNRIFLTENMIDGELYKSDIMATLRDRKISFYDFSPMDQESLFTEDEEFLEQVKIGKEHCKKGDVFQIVLSRKFSQSFKGDEFNVYRSLRSINPSPYLFYFDYGNYKLLGSSPETHISIDKSIVSINPIAGTFKRTGNDKQDMLLAEELRVDKKENSEHIMLVDLARNDLSRMATKVKVDTFKEIQYYSHLLHMVSTVTGELADDVNKIRVYGDSFPAGTLSGAPKYRAMEIIDRVEKVSRGFYGGAIGFLGFNGDINHAIMIRTALSKGNKLFYQAGAGVVESSIPESELQETNNKINAMRSAINAASEF